MKQLNDEGNLEMVVFRMRQTALARGEARIEALTKAKADLAARTAAVVERHPEGAPRIEPSTTTPSRSGGATGRGFKVSGQVTVADGGFGLPGVRLRIVDSNGLVVLEKPTWTTGPNGHYTVDLTASEAKANASQLVELADGEGNPLERLDRSVAAGVSVEANVALETPPAGSALANQITATKTSMDQKTQDRAQLAASIDALRTGELINQGAIDLEIAKLRATINSLNV